MEKVISVAELARNASTITRDVATAGTVYRITRGGHSSVVLIDEDYFNSWQAAIEEMQRPGWREKHEQAMRDVAAGRGRDLEEVAKELGLAGRSDTRRPRRTRRVTRARRAKGR